VNESHRNKQFIREMKHCLDGIQMFQNEAKDINEINSSSTNDCRTMPMDDLECASRVEPVMIPGRMERTLATGGNFKA
jgi:hypothetical protein